MHTAFFFVFATEISIKLIGLGFSNFFNDKYNTLDLIVALVTSVDAIMALLPTNLALNHDFGF